MQESREEPDLEEVKAQFNDVFSLRKPKDAKAGLSSGAKSIGKGVLAGVVGLVAAPVMMAREEGVKGFAKGVGAGSSNLVDFSANDPNKLAGSSCNLMVLVSRRHSLRRSLGKPS